MDETVKALLEANLKLTDQFMELARAVIESRGVVTTQQVTPRSLSFEEFSGGGSDLSPAEKLFYSEQEEDEKYEAEMFGSGPETPPEVVKEILTAAGLDPSTVSTA